jgi:hypothetical protein
MLCCQCIVSGYFETCCAPVFHYNITMVILKFLKKVKKPPKKLPVPFWNQAVLQGVDTTRTNSSSLLKFFTCPDPILAWFWIFSDIWNWNWRLLKIKEAPPHWKKQETHKAWSLETKSPNLPTKRGSVIQRGQCHSLIVWGHASFRYILYKCVGLWVFPKRTSVMWGSCESAGLRVFSVFHVWECMSTEFQNWCRWTTQFFHCRHPLLNITKLALSHPPAQSFGFGPVQILLDDRHICYINSGAVPAKFALWFFFWAFFWMPGALWFVMLTHVTNKLARISRTGTDCLKTDCLKVCQQLQHLVVLIVVCKSMRKTKRLSLHLLLLS